MIAQFQYSPDLQEIIDYVIGYYHSHEVFSLQHVIENADITISTSLIDILHGNGDAVMDIDIDHVINNLLLLNLDEEIEKLKVSLKDSDTPSLVQQQIQMKVIEKQALTLKLRNHKLKI